MLKSRREPNFNAAECELLVRLVRKYVDVLENKRTDAASSKLKDHTWAILAHEFNTSSGQVLRDAKSLRFKYENLKKNLKKKFSVPKSLQYGTGEGPVNIIEDNITPLEEHIMEITGLRPAINGLDSQYDCDEITHITEDGTCSVEKEQNTSHVSIVVDVDPLIKEEDGAENNSAEKLIQEKRFVIKNKKCAFSTQKRKTHNNPKAFNGTMHSYQELAFKRIKLIDAEIRRVEEKIRQDKEEHELKCTLMKIEIELKKKSLTE